MIKKSPARIIFGAALPGDPDEVPVVVKIYRHANLGEWLKANLCGSKARREWRITTAAAARGLPTVVPVAFGTDAWEVSLKDLPYLQVGPYYTNTRAGLQRARDILRRRGRRIPGAIIMFERNRLRLGRRRLRAGGTWPEFF